MSLDQPLRRVWGQSQSSGSGPMQAIVRRLRRKLGEDASLLICFFTKRRGGHRMDRAKRRNRKRHNRAEKGRRGHCAPLSFLQPVTGYSKADGSGSSHCPQPHLEDGTAYRLIRPTILPL